MRLIGHRGCPARAPENTVSAVRRAAPHVDAVEVDVQRCASGELVVFHDETLDRLTDGSGRVRETPWRELRDLVVRGTDALRERRRTSETAARESDDRDNTTIPRLSNLLAVVPASVAVNVELKHEGMADEVADYCERIPNDVFVSSFLPGALAELGEVSDLDTALLFAASWEANFDTATDLGCRYLHPGYRLCLDAPERLAAAHDAGFEVNAWTVPTPADAERLILDGVDGLIVDDWAVV